jgi:sirohydrochlorin ferrochelatase
MILRRFPLLLLVFLLSVLSVPGSQATNPGVKVGILVMAHGGTPEWNAAVVESVAPFSSILPVRIAFGMAQPGPLQRAVQELEDEGVTHIAAVGLLVSSQSFREQTEYLLSLRTEPPAMYLQHHGDGDLSMSHHIEMIPGNLAPAPIQRDATMLLNREGLYDSTEIGRIIVERVAALSTSPEKESVLILAHGEGDNQANSQWVSRVGDLAAQVRESGPFRQVQVETLREDWKDQRARAEERIRSFVQEQGSRGNKVLVVPFRVFGFGPYAEVLEGLEYRSDGRGLLPHPIIADWIREQANDCFKRMGIDHLTEEPNETAEAGAGDP